jgi:uncharacterized protein (DUF362 family)
MTTVSVVHGENRRENLIRALELLPPGIWDKLKSAQSVLIKPNLVHHRNPLASSHVDAVRAVIDFVRQHSDAPITVGDASYHGTKAAFRNFGYENLPAEYENVRLLDLNDDVTVPGYYIKRDGSRGEMNISQTAAEAGFKIDLAVMKTHRDAGVSLTVKNWTIGTWVAPARIGIRGKYWPRSEYLHDEGTEAHHSTIAELLHQQRPDLAVLDGHLAMEGQGPTEGQPVKMKVALAGADSCAVDSIACGLMGIDPHGIQYLAMAENRGYGIIGEQQIAVVGETDWKMFRQEFKRI